MVKLFLKDTDQEVKVGDVIDISIPMETPFGMGVTTVSKVKINGDTLKALLAKGIIIAKKMGLSDQEFISTYKPILRRMARKHEITFEHLLSLLDTVKDISPIAYNVMLIEAIADKINQGKKITGEGYAVTLSKSGYTVAKASSYRYSLPIFATREDAELALKLLNDFIDE